MQVSFGHHSSVLVPRVERERLRTFYCDILGAELVKSEPDRDFINLSGHYLVPFYADIEDASEFLRSGRSVWLELQTDDVEALTKRVRDSGLVMQLELPDPHFYFQAPGGQCLRIVGIHEDLSAYEGRQAAPTAVMDAIKERATT